jgi:hypothetical protein
MRGVSWKALLVATVAYAVAIVFVDAVINATAAIAMLAGYGAAASRVFDTFRSLPAVVIAQIVFSLGSASLAAGYLAARTAGDGHLLNGTVATIGPSLLCLYALVHDPLFEDAQIFGPWVKPLFNAAVFVGGPMLGALGGYLAELRQARLEAMITDEIAASNNPPLRLTAP